MPPKNPMIKIHKNKRTKTEIIIEKYLSKDPYPSMLDLEILAKNINRAISTIERYYTKYRKAHPELYGIYSRGITKGVSYNKIRKEMLSKEKIAEVKKNVSKLKAEIKKQSKDFKISKKAKDKVERNLSPLKDIKDNPIVFENVEAALNDFIEFVGFRGYYNKKGKPIIDLTAISELDEKGNEIELFVHDYHEGEAFPQPIDGEGRELGVLLHEAEGFESIFVYLKTGIMFKWARGFGKTYLCSWFMQWSMLRFGWAWMYLSVTAVLADVAFWIYKWAKQNNLITKAIKGGKQNTYTQFELVTGAKLRIFDYMGEDMVGQHNWHIAMDDIVKRKWEEKPSENRKAKKQWIYSLGKMKRKGLMIFGTRKFEGDLLEYLENVLPKLHIEVKTPYIMEGEFPEWSPKLEIKTLYVSIDEASEKQLKIGEAIYQGEKEFVMYQEEREVLWVPELYTYEELEAKKLSPTDDGVDPLMAWMSEMMQDPRPLQGGSWQPGDLVFITHFDTWDYEAAVIAVDPAFTIEPDSDETGITVNLLHKDLGEENNRQFLCIRAYGMKVKVQDWSESLETARNKDGMVFYENGVKMIKHKGMLTLIEELFQYLKNQFPGLRTIIVAIETNSGGDIIIQQIQHERDKYEFAGHIVEVKHTSISKKDRIDKELFTPIKMGYQKFLDILRGTDLIYQILTFPNSKLIDMLDSLGMGKDELNKLKRITVAQQRRERIINDIKDAKRNRAKKEFDAGGLKGLRTINPKSKRTMLS